MVVKIILSVIGFLLLIDIVSNLFGGRSAGGLTTALCRPFFGVLYPKIGMFLGLILWLIEFAIVISVIWMWFI